VNKAIVNKVSNAAQSESVRSRCRLPRSLASSEHASRRVRPSMQARAVIHVREADEQAQQGPAMRHGRQ